MFDNNPVMAQHMLYKLVLTDGYLANRDAIEMAKHEIFRLKQLNDQNARKIGKY